MVAIKSTATPYIIKTWLILRLPQEVSLQLPSRGQVMVKGQINSADFRLPLEPDGRSGHWLHINEQLQKTANVTAGKAAQFQIETTKDWPNPELPEDFTEALNAAGASLQKHWEAITPMAKHEWLRWINATASTETREKRIQVALSKLNNGEKRPCCFNRNMCCVPEVSKSGVLLDQNGEKVQN